MARRPPRGTTAGKGKLIGHARLDPGSGTEPGVAGGGTGGLERLGQVQEPPSTPPTGPSDAFARATSGTVPGAGTPSAAAAAAETPDATPGVAPPPTVRPVKRRGRGRTRGPGERVFRWVALIVAVVLVAAGSVYGYLWYRLGEIKSIKCTSCVAEVPGSPYNVLIVGSDSRAGDTGSAAKAFGTASEVGGQRSDTIKILHIDPATGTARLLSIPRDTYVALSGMPATSELPTDS